MRYAQPLQVSAPADGRKTIRGNIVFVRPIAAMSGGFIGACVCGPCVSHRMGSQVPTSVRQLEATMIGRPVSLLRQLLPAHRRFLPFTTASLVAWCGANRQKLSQMSLTFFRCG